MDFKQLQSFTAVVRYQNFTKAAEMTFTSQPTVSTHIRQLEEELNTRLLSRSTRVVLPTRDGETLYLYAQKILELRDSMMKEFTGTGKSVICLGASTIPAQYFVPKLIADYKKKVPEVQFRLKRGDSAEIIALLEEGSIDVGFIGTECRRTDISCMPVYRDKLVLIVPNTEAYLRLLQPEPDYRAILTGPMIFREMGSGSRKAGEAVFAHFGIRENMLNIVAEMNDHETIKRLVAAGMGAAILSSGTLSTDAEKTDYLTVSLPEGIGIRNINLIYPKENGFGRGQSFVEYVRRSLRQ